MNYSFFRTLKSSTCSTDMTFARAPPPASVSAIVPAFSLPPGADMSSLSLTVSTRIRLARPSLDLDAAVRFYVQGLGLQVLYQTPSDGQSFALLMLGLPGAIWHLELTQLPTHPITPTPTADDLLVLYCGEPISEAIVTQLERYGGQRVAAFNPYWDEWGVTIQDPDGYLVVLCQRSWTA